MEESKMSTLELNNYVDDYFDLLDEISRLQAQAEAIKDVIKFVMVEKETEEISGSGWRATWHNTKTERIDGKALKAALPEIYQEYSKTTMSTRFTLNRVKSN